ncbi:thioredoxin [bacterium]|nr:thioredoxin [bacterium]MBU1650995.1 thioredoxin [bacterium]MBU1881376.1 thioredoxin [bacterium]
MENEITLNDQNFDTELVNGSEPVLVDFWAEWCMPCRMVAPILSELADEYKGKLKIGKLNVDHNPMTASRFGISSIPSLILFKDGKKVEQWIGAMPKPMLESALQPHLADKN